MRLTVKFGMVVVFFLPLSKPLLAQSHDIPGSKDHSLISRYPGSVIDDYAAKAYESYTLPLGKIGQGEIEKSQPLEGKLTRIHYAIPSGRSTLEVLRNYQDAMQKAGFQTLFTCALAQCGTGSIEGQTGWCGGCSARHISAKLARLGGDVYVSLHIEQDNDTTPAWAEIVIVEMKPMESGLITVSADSLAGDLSRTGHASIYGIYFDTGKADVKPESNAALAEISKLLGRDTLLKLYVVGHTDNVGALAGNMDLSKRRADAVVQVLTTKYNIASARLSAHGDGPTAPMASNDSEEGRAKNRRVELVKQ